MLLSFDVKPHDYSKLPKEFKHLLPDNLETSDVKLVLDKVDNSISNAIRRTLLGELPVIVMRCKYEDIDTDDEYLHKDIVLNRFPLIPLLQNVNMNTTFSLKATNNDSITRSIKLREITPNKWFDGNITLCELRKGKYLKISNIRLELATDKGYASMASNCASIANVEPINHYTKKGVPVGINNASQWSIKFTNLGCYKPWDLYIYALDTIIKRVEKAKDELIENLKEYGNNGDMYLYQSYFEDTETIAQLYMRDINKLDDVILTTNTAHKTTLFKLQISSGKLKDAEDIIIKSTMQIKKIFNGLYKIKK